MKKARLKRRLRKKYRVGEFQEFGFQVKVKFKPNPSESLFDKFCGDFIELIEANKPAFGGGSSSETLQGFVTAREKYCSPMASQKEKFEKWLESRPEISESEVGKLVDAWYDIK